MKEHYWYSAGDAFPPDLWWDTAEPSPHLHSGQTRPGSPHTEAQSYLRLAIATKLLPSAPSSAHFFPRVTTEDYALDSYQNLIFSIARFHEVTGLPYTERTTRKPFLNRVKADTPHG